MRLIYILVSKGGLKYEDVFHNKNPLTPDFYNGTTGVEPVDTVIKKSIKYSYCHHIERLMVLNNFMLLKEIDPKQVYKWFMEVFIDAYDWVMVGNIYGMGQYCLKIMTRPYLSSFNYIKNMYEFDSSKSAQSNEVRLKLKESEKIWNDLYKKFMASHKDVLSHTYIYASYYSKQKI